MIANADSTVLIYSQEHMRVKAYKGRALDKYSSRGVIISHASAHACRRHAIRDSLEEEVLIALVRAAWLAAERSNAVTAAAGLSPSQYNVLRILRAAGRGGLSCTEI